MGDLVISRDHMDEMVAHARESLPDEACGMLGGLAGRVHRVYRLGNSDPSPVSYAVDPIEQLKAMKDMAESGTELVGIYHSHPGAPPLPSITDINRAFFPGTRDLNYPDVVYVIISLSGPAPEVKAFMIEREGVRTVELSLH